MKKTLLLIFAAAALMLSGAKASAQVSVGAGPATRLYFEKGQTVDYTYGVQLNFEDSKRLTDVFGLEVTEAEELYPDEKTALFVPSDFKGKYSARGIMECIENHGAYVMVRCASGPYQDFPALLRKQVGEGFAYYLGTDCGDTLLKAHGDLPYGLVRLEHHEQESDHVHPVNAGEKVPPPEVLRSFY